MAQVTDTYVVHGNLTGPIVGLTMKAIVGRAIAEIRSQQHSFEAKAKPNVHKPDKEDFVTSADRRHKPSTSSC
jgi:hypothetical protein